MYVSTMRGLGLSNQETVQAVSAGAGVATPVIGGIIAAHAAATAAATGVPALVLGMTPALAVPVIGAAIVGVTMLAVMLIKNSGCGQTCVVTSQWANQAADALQKNLDAYRATVPHTKATQGVALANFDAIWAALEQQCGQPGTGDAGKRCISDRQRGACTWKDNGQCWDWFIAYRDPIANDPNVVDDSLSATSVSETLDSLFSSGGGSTSLLPILLIGGLVWWAAS